MAKQQAGGVGQEKDQLGGEREEEEQGGEVDSEHGLGPRCLPSRVVYCSELYLLI